jgi:translation initiation factor 3 subunit B
MRQRDIAEWNAWRAKNNRRLAEERARRGVERKKAVKQEANEKVEEWVEELIDETEEVVVA